MKKLTTLLILCICTIVSFGQFPNNQGSGNASTLYTFAGASKSTYGMTLGDQTDTNTVNTNPYMKGVAGLHIRTGNLEWMRNNATNTWLGPFLMGAFNGLSVDMSNAKAQLGGDMTKNDTISLEDFNLYIQHGTANTNVLEINLDNNAGMVHLNAPSLTEVGFRYTARDYGWARNQIWNISDTTAGGAASGLDIRMGSAGSRIGQLYYGGLNNSFMTDGFMIASIGGVGGLRLAANSGPIVFTVTNSGGGEYARFTNSRMGIGTTTPTHTLTLGSGQFRIAAINNASVFDSVLVINDGVVEARLASTIVTARPNLYYNSPLFAWNDSTIAIDTGVGRPSTKLYVTTRYLVDSLISVKPNPTWQQTLTAGPDLSASVTSNRNSNNFLLYNGTAGAGIFLGSTGAGIFTAVAGDNNYQSYFTYPDSAVIYSNGVIRQSWSGTTYKIHALANTSTQDRLVGQVGGTGQIGYLTYASPLNITSGVLGITASAVTVPINNLLAATGTNTIDNTSYNQIWQWTGTVGEGLTLQKTSGSWTASGRLLAVYGGGSAGTGNISAGYFIGSATGTGSTTGIYVSANNNSTVNRSGYFTVGGTATTNYGIFSEAPVAGGTTNIAGYFTATNGANNYAIIVPASSGLIGLGTTTPTAGILHIINPVTSGTTTTSGLVHLMNALTTGTGEYIASSSLSSGKIIDIVITGTAQLSAGAGINVNRSGANGSTAQTIDGIISTITNTNATSGTNRALVGIASGATTANWALFTGSATGADGRINVNNATNTANQVMVIKSLTNTAGDGIIIKANNETASLQIGYQTIATTGGMILNSSATGVQVASRMYIGASGTTPTSILHLLAGTTAASSAPLKFTSGSLMTTAEAGAVEFLTDKFYGTITTGAVRKEITLNDAALTSGRVPYVTTNGRLTDASTLTYNGTTLTVTGNTVVSGQQSSTAQTVTYGTTITWDWNSGTNAVVTLTGNITTFNISNAVAGTYATIRMVQDGTGSRLLSALPANSKVINGGAGAIVLSTAANSIDLLTVYYDGTNYYWNYGKNYN